MPEVWQVVACVGVAKPTALGIEDAIEAGYEHVGWYGGMKRLIDSLEHLAGRGRVQGLGYCPEHAARGGHDQRCGHALAGSISYHKPQPTLREEVEVVEVSSHLPSARSGDLLGN